MNDKINLMYELNSEEAIMKDKTLSWIEDYLEDIRKMLNHLIDNGYEVRKWDFNFWLFVEYEQQ